MGGGDGFADGGEGGGGNELDAGGCGTDAELIPEVGEVDGHGIVFPFGVHAGEDVGAGGAVADGEGLVEGPVVVDGAALGDDGAEGVLEAFSVLGFAADGDVGHEAEERAAPVGASPGVGAIDALVAVGG